MAKRMPPKDPQAVLEYRWDWKALTNGNGSSDWLASGETISSYTVTVVDAAPSGVTKDSDALASSNTAVVAWFSGGTDKTDYRVTCQIVTSAGRTDERTIIIPVRSR